MSKANDNSRTFKKCSLGKDRIRKLARKLNRKGEDVLSAIAAVQKQFKDCDPQDISEVVSQIYKSEKDLHSIDDLHPVEKIQIMFKKAYPEAKRNDITGEIEINGVSQKEEDLNSILIDFQIELGKSRSIGKDWFFTFLNSNHIRSFNPIKQFFETGEKLNNSNNSLIKKLAGCIKTDTGFSEGNFCPDYVETFVTKWLVGVVASVYGYFNSLMLVLCGEKQNTGKTHFFRNLLPNELSPYLAEPKGLENMKEENRGMIMCEYLIVLDDEMQGRSKQDEKKFKSLVSSQIFTLRKPYAKKNERYRRLASLCGTTNDLNILGDPTGNRRIIPINVLSIDHEAYNSVDKKGLFLEAFRLFKSGFNWELSNDDIQLLNENTLDFKTVDSVTELIQKYFDPPSEFIENRLTATVITVLLRKLTGQNFSPNLLGIRLKKLGYKQQRSDSQGTREYIIQLTEKAFEQISSKEGPPYQK